MTNRKKSALVLLSGGLDSAVSVPLSECDIKLGVIFDYGQNAFKEEKKAAEKIAKYYKFPLKEIKLDWLKDILSNGLSDSNKIFKLKNLKNKNSLEKSMKSVWVPNRNALFINIAASICETENIEAIIIGANKEEGKTFKDNTKSFINRCNSLLKYSTNKKIEVLAPLINLNKSEIVKKALDLNIPLEYIFSCYKSGGKHCGECESCIHLKTALENNKAYDLIKKLF